MPGVAMRGVNPFLRTPGPAMHAAVLVFTALAALLGDPTQRFSLRYRAYETPPTLEWRTANADLVVTARITGVQASSADDQTPTVALTLETIEAIKGDPPATLEVRLADESPRATLARGLAGRMDAGDVDLWFLSLEDGGDIARPIEGGVVASFVFLERSPPVCTPDAWLTRPPPPALTRDGARYDGKAAILDAARRVAAMDLAVGDVEPPVPWERIEAAEWWDWDLVKNYRNSAFRAALIEPWLEPLALAMVHEPARFLPPAEGIATQEDRDARAREETAVRAEGVRLLGMSFPLADHEELFDELRSDWSEVFRADPGLAEPTYRFKAVGAHAERALDQLMYARPITPRRWPMHLFSPRPDAAAIAKAHGPAMEGLAVAEMHLELSGDQNPEYLQLWVPAAGAGARYLDLERLRTEGAHAVAMALFRHEDGAYRHTFHRVAGPGGFSLTLHEHDGRPMLLIREGDSWDTRTAYGWWPSEDGDGAWAWSARAGDWDYETATFTPTGAVASIRSAGR
ncbi:hypothetical protein AY599_27630 [Leptolyngbya valderiana BDU 20041]|nr:hypothetical protein AY599_27630 [Leptolyngbya valderiana BDU 20041]